MIGTSCPSLQAPPEPIQEKLTRAERVLGSTTAADNKHQQLCGADMTDKDSSNMLNDKQQPELVIKLKFKKSLASALPPESSPRTTQSQHFEQAQNVAHTPQTGLPSFHQQSQLLNSDPALANFPPYLQYQHFQPSMAHAQRLSAPSQQAVCQYQLQVGQSSFRQQRVPDHQAPLQKGLPSFLQQQGQTNQHVQHGHPLLQPGHAQSQKAQPPQEPTSARDPGHPKRQPHKSAEYPHVKIRVVPTPAQSKYQKQQELRKKRQNKGNGIGVSATVDVTADDAAVTVRSSRSRQPKPSLKVRENAALSASSSPSPAYKVNAADVREAVAAGVSDEDSASTAKGGRDRPRNKGKGIAKGSLAPVHLGNDANGTSEARQTLAEEAMVDPPEAVARLQPHSGAVDANEAGKRRLSHNAEQTHDLPESTLRFQRLGYRTFTDTDIETGETEDRVITRWAEQPNTAAYHFDVAMGKVADSVTSPWSDVPDMCLKAIYARQDSVVPKTVYRNGYAALAVSEGANGKPVVRLVPWAKFRGSKTWIVVTTMESKEPECRRMVMTRDQQPVQESNWDIMLNEMTVFAADMRDDRRMKEEAAYAHARQVVKEMRTKKWKVRSWKLLLREMRSNAKEWKSRRRHRRLMFAPMMLRRARALRARQHRTLAEV